MSAQVSVQIHGDVHCHLVATPFRISHSRICVPLCFSMHSQYCIFFSVFLATSPESTSTSTPASQLDRKVRCEQKETNLYGETVTH